MESHSYSTKPQNKIRDCWIASGIAVGFMLVLSACGQSSTPSSVSLLQPTASVLVLHADIDYMVASEVLGVVVDEKMNVVHVEKGSGAENAGIQLGDTLDSINSVSFITDRARVKELIGEKAEGKYLTLKLKRDQKDLEMVIIASVPVPQSGMNTPTAVPPTQDYF